MSKWCLEEAINQYDLLYRQIMAENPETAKNIRTVKNWLVELKKYREKEERLKTLQFPTKEVRVK